VSLINSQTSPANIKNIAICISGQVARWIPESILENLIKPNQKGNNPNSTYDYHFHLFFNIQYSSDKSSTIFSTNSALVFPSPPLVSKSHSDLLSYITNLYHNQAYNAKVGQINFAPPRSLQEWKSIQAKEIGNADRISMYAATQHVVLNLYGHQSRCYHQIEQYEKTENIPIHYVINTREDIYYFKPLYLSNLLENNFSHKSYIHNHRANASAEAKQPLSTTSSTVVDAAKCDLIAKNCLKWNGINMRWQLFPRKYAPIILNTRFDYYQLLYNRSETIHNPEMFELAQLKHHGLNVCEYPVDFIPVAAARYVKPNVYCFIPQEVGDKCQPTGFNPFIRQHLCNRFANDSISHIRKAGAPVSPTTSIPAINQSKDNKRQKRRTETLRPNTV
jgi:hypothetical protein